MKAAIDITPEQRKTLLALLHRFIPGVAVWAYGSRVKWTARTNSDLDLVAFTTPAQSHLVSELKEALGESNLPFLVDLHVWDEVPERFHEIIRKEYVVLQEAKQLKGDSAIADKWRESTWGDEISLEYGKSLRGYDNVKGKYRVYGSNGPIGWTSQPLAPGPGVILGRKGAYRGVQYSREPFFVIDTAYYVVPKTDLDMRWLYYAIQHYKLGEIDDGSPIPSTTRSAVYVQDFQIPPPPEQKAIAAVLGALDDKIELNRRMNATLEAMARALFQSWFVDFDPVRAKLDGRKPAGLDAATAALFPAHFQNSPLGHIPQGWAVGTIEDATSLIIDYRGRTPKKMGGDWSETGIPAISAKNVKAGRLVRPEMFNFVSEELFERWMKDKLAIGDILMTSEAPLGELCYLALEARYCLSQRVFALRANPTSCESTFLYYWLESPSCHTEIINRGTGTTVEGIRQSELRQVSVLLPPLPIQKAAARFLAEWIEQIHYNEEQSRTLATLRDALLPKLLSGEVLAPEIQSTSHQPHQ